MKKLFCVLLLVTFAALFAPAVANADTPTPAPSATPTLRPIPPTATSAMLYLRPTPTPFELQTPAYIFDLHLDPGPSADIAINTWHFINRDHLADFIATGVLFLFVIGLLIATVNRTTRSKQ